MPDGLAALGGSTHPFLKLALALVADVTGNLPAAMASQASHVPRVMALGYSSEHTIDC